jgi:hypothetical protein
MPYRKFDGEQLSSERAGVLREDPYELSRDNQLRHIIVVMKMVANTMNELLQRELIQE